ncbi:MAG: hypothetical protein ACE5J6_04510 [Candidatus Bathyarchaeia archaeon]
MEKKKVSALASLWMILLASFVLVAPIPPASAQPTGNYRYWVMGVERGPPLGSVMIIDSLNEAPEDHWNFTIPSMFLSQNITFSEPWELTPGNYLVNLTVPAESYTGISHMLYDTTTTFWIRFSINMTQDGKGWIFLNATGDVDCHTFSNDTAVYWRSPSPKAGQKAADFGALPSPGLDGVAGTADDGFGDGTPDPRGSSILMLLTNIKAEYHTGTQWITLFQMTWPQVFTTANASAIVDDPGWTGLPETGSPIHGANQSDVGEPWEYYAGLDHPGDQVGWTHQNSTAYVTYVCAWSMLDISTTLGPYDLCFTIKEKKVREDLLIADIDCDEESGLYDVVKIGVAYGAQEANWGSDGIPYTGDDKITRDTNFDGRADLKPDRGLIDIFDLVRCAIDYGSTLTSSGVSGP